LIDHAGQEVFTLTPLNGLSWIFDGVYERRHEDGITVIEASTTENPHLDAAAMAAFFAGLTDEELQARRDGKFVHLAGLVFPEFDDHLHVIDPLPSMAGPEDHSDNPLWGRDVFVGIDPGIRWTGITFNAFDRHGDLIVFDELLLTDSIVPRTVRAIQSKLGEWGIPQASVRFVIDPSARNRALTNGEHVEGEFARFGIFCIHGQNDVETGLFQLKRRLQGEPVGIRITRNCRRLLWEIGRYRRKEMPDGSFAVLKKDDHELDSLRYVSMARPFIHALPMGRAHRDSKQYREQWLRNIYDGQGGHPMGSMA